MFDAAILTVLAVAGIAFAGGLALWCYAAVQVLKGINSALNRR